MNKQKRKKSAGQLVEPTRGSQRSPGSGGPDNYDGRENKRAETPPPPTTEVKGSGKRIGE